jgi:hypothetical protein
MQKGLVRIQRALKRQAVNFQVCLYKNALLPRNTDPRKEMK